MPRTNKWINNNIKKSNKSIKQNILFMLVLINSSSEFNPRYLAYLKPIYNIGLAATKLKLF